MSSGSNSDYDESIDMYAPAYYYGLDGDPTHRTPNYARMLPDERPGEIVNLMHSLFVTPPRPTQQEGEDPIEDEDDDIDDEDSGYENESAFDWEEDPDGWRGTGERGEDDDGLINFTRDAVAPAPQDWEDADREIVNLMHSLEDADHAYGLINFTRDAVAPAPHPSLNVREALEDEDACCVCLVNYPNATLLACKHCICCICAERLFKDRKNCPLCRQEIPAFQVNPVADAAWDE